MSDNVLLFNGATMLDIPVDKVLKAAIEANMNNVIVIGDIGDELYFASSIGARKEEKIIYLLELAKHKLLSGDFEQE